MKNMPWFCLRFSDLNCKESSEKIIIANLYGYMCIFSSFITYVVFVIFLRALC